MLAISVARATPCRSSSHTQRSARLGTLAGGSHPSAAAISSAPRPSAVSSWRKRDERKWQWLSLIMVIGLVSDTHSLVRPGIFEALEGVELILHAGDVGGR